MHIDMDLVGHLVQVLALGEISPCHPLGQAVVCMSFWEEKG